MLERGIKTNEVATINSNILFPIQKRGFGKVGLNLQTCLLKISTQLSRWSSQSDCTVWTQEPQDENPATLVGAEFLTFLSMTYLLYIQ